MAYFPDSIYLDPYRPYPHPFPKTPVIKDKRVEFFHYLNYKNSLYHDILCQYISIFRLYNKSYSSKHTEVF